MLTASRAWTLAVVFVLLAVAGAWAAGQPPAERSLPRLLATPAPAASVPAPFARRSLNALAPVPRMPLTGGKQRHVRSATGATIAVVEVAGCASAVGTIYNQNCQITWTGSALPAGTHQDYLYTPNSTVAAPTGSTYTTATGPSNSLTLAAVGTYILGSYNQTSATWDAVVYLVVGNAVVFGTYSDSFLSLAATQFVAKNPNNVYISASGLTPTDTYVVTIESTSVGTQSGVCAAYLPANTSTPPPPSLCDASRSPGQTAPGGTFTVAWALANTMAAGTYSIALYDKTISQRLAQRQIALVKNGAVSSWSLTPVAGNASPAPAPAGTPTVKFAFDGATEAADKGLSASATGLTPSGAYVEAISDPNGTVVSKQTQAADGTGAVNITWNFGAAQSPLNAIGNTYTLSLLAAGSTTLDTVQAFSIVGYSASTQFTSPLGTAEDISAGSVTTGIKFTNTSDLVYGAGNGDPIVHISAVSDPLFAGVTLAGGSPQVITDSNGQAWTVTLTCTGGCGGGPGNKTFTFDLVPNTAGQALKIGSSITIPNVTFTTSGRCGVPGCAVTTTILPQDGLTWSSAASGATNKIYFTDGGGTTFAGTASIALYGTRTSATVAPAIGKEVHGYTTRFNQAVYAFGQPSTPGGTPQDEFSFTLNNTSTAGSSTVTDIQITFPTSFNVASAQVDSGNTGTPAGAAAWLKATCPAGTPANVMCITKTGANAGLAAQSSQTIYVYLNAPSAAFSYTDIGVQTSAPVKFAFGPVSSSVALFVPSTQTIDSMAIGSYSLDSTLISPLFNPTSVGSNGTYNVNIAVANAPSASTPFGDYLDLVIIDLPSANTLSSIVVSTAGWTSLGAPTSVGGKNRYWFGLCASQYSTVNPPNDGVANCGSATEQSALAPAGGSATSTLNIAAKIVTQSAGTITATAYAHGANVGGWSAGSNFNLTVSDTAAAVGFYKVGSYNSPALVPTNTEPQIGADSNAANGNSYVYQIQNTGAQPITDAIITIPRLETTGADGRDTAGQGWQIATAAFTPAISGSPTYGCQVVSYANPNYATSADGFIRVAGCSIPTGQTVYVSFNAFAPYKVNSTYSFPATVNAPLNVAASESWFSDSLVKIVLSASVNIDVPPYLSSPGGSTPSVTCVGCSYSLNYIDFGAALNNTTTNYTDVLRASVTTNAASPIGWQLYVSANTNPVRAPATPSNELLVSVDSANSSPKSPTVNFDQTAPAVVLTSGNGVLLVDTGTGTAARRLPFEMLTSYQLSIGTEPIVAQQSVLTFTFISN